MKRILASIIVSTVAFFGLAAAPAHAVSDRDVPCSGGGYFKVRGNKVVQKQGAESDFANRCKGTGVIPDGVTEIGDYGFNTEDQMSNIVIPDSVTKIGGAGLADTHLTSINLPAGLTDLSAGALAYNGFLTTLVIPANVATIGTFVLFGAHGLCNIYFLGVTAPNADISAFPGICEGSPWTTGAPTGDGNPKAWPPQGATGYGPLGSSYRGLTVSSGAAVVLFDANGADSGSVPTTQVLSPGASVQLPPDAGTLTRANFTFLGWNVSKDGEGQNYSPNASFVAPEGTTILYANWLGDPKVKYDGNNNNGGSAPVDPDSPHPKNSSVTVLGNSGSLTKTGATFSGWNTQADGSGNTYQPSDTFTIATTSVTLYAKWVPETHTVTYDGNGFTGGAVPVDVLSPYAYHASVTVLGNTGSLVRDGYSFAGWSFSPSGIGPEIAISSSFGISTNDVVLYAKWTPQQYGVTYFGNGNSDGNSPGGPTPHDSGSLYTVLGNTGSMTKTGYAFGGWNTAADGSGIDRPVGSTFTIGATNINLYAKWNRQSYTVTYDGNGFGGGTVPVDPSPHVYNSSVTVYNGAGLTKSGYLFAGWNTAADGSGTHYGYPSQILSMPGANVVLYAEWASPVTVAYDGNGNSDGTPPNETLSPFPSGSQITCHGNDGSLVKTGYKFTGWNSAANGSGVACSPNESVTVSVNTTWYAQWAPAYSVTYNGNLNSSGTAPVDPSSYPSGDWADVPGEGNLARDGYEFGGWNTAADGSGIDVSPGSEVLHIGTSDLVLYAKWLPLFGVTYVGNGSTAGSVPIDQDKYLAGGHVSVMGNTGHLSRTGYTFTGWNSAADGHGTHYASTGSVTYSVGNASVTFYAEWTKNSVHSPKSVSDTFYGFKYYQSTLSASQKKQIRTWLNKNVGLTHVSCTGYTGYNSRHVSDKSLETLARTRASNVCTYIHQLRPSVKVSTIDSVQLTSKNSNSRRVRVKLF